MPKIIHIITRLDRGGSALETLLTCHELGPKYQIVLAHGLSRESKMTELESQSLQKGIDAAKNRWVRFVPVPALVRHINPISDVRALYALWRLILREKPVIVHTHTSKAGMLGRMAAKLAGVSIIVHKPHGHVFYGHFGRIASRLFLAAERFLSHLTDRIIALTDGELNDYVALSVCPPEKLVKIHSGVDISKFQRPPGNIIEKKREMGLNQNGVLIGFVGWLLPIKGPMYLLKAVEDVWRDYEDTMVVFIGKGELDVDLRAEALKISANGRVSFLGWRSDIDEIMPLFDIFVLPSLNEGMGRVLVEAMAAGKPIVASNVGGIPDLVQHGHNGLLVPPGDEKALAASIRQLIDDPDKAKMMGQRGRERCHQFSIAAMIEKIDALYMQLLQTESKDPHLPN